MLVDAVHVKDRRIVGDVAARPQDQESSCGKIVGPLLDVLTDKQIAGDLLDKQIQAIGFERSQVYIANVVKCRPPKNRTPLANEVEACSGYLRRQIELIRPQVIITLGGPAAKLVLNVDQGITRIRGIWHEYTGVQPGVPVMPTFHPAYLLRQYTKENRAKVWSDLKAALGRLEQTRD